MERIFDHLLNAIDEIYTRFNYVKAGEATYDFELDVKPFVHRIDQQIEQLKAHREDVLQFTYMNPMRFSRLTDNLSSISVDCHYKQTSKKVFFEKYKAVHYDLVYLRKYRDSQ